MEAQFGACVRKHFLFAFVLRQGDRCAIVVQNQTVGSTLRKFYLVSVDYAMWWIERRLELELDLADWRGTQLEAAKKRRQHANYQ